MITDLQKQIGTQLLGYRKDPCGFAIDVLGFKPEFIWDKMREVCESVRDNQFTAVPAGHSVSKTVTAGRIIVPWFKMCFQPSTIVTTAPSDNQIRNQLWREIHAGVNGAKIPLGGNLTNLMWDAKPSDDIMRSLSTDDRGQWSKNFAIGFSTSPDTLSEHTTKMQGWHNEWVLVILDEASGVLPQIWKTVLDSLVTNPRVKVLAIGNPTEAYGYFADVCKPGSGWNVVRISCCDTPNYKENKDIIPGVAGREYADRMAKAYGVNSNTYKTRILGIAPEYTEGTYFGELLSRAEKEGRIKDIEYIRSVPVITFWDIGDIHTAIWFLQIIGEGDNTTVQIIDFYYDNRGLGMKTWAAEVLGKGYIYSRHIGPWDIADKGPNSKSNQTDKTLLDVAKQHGIDFETLVAAPFNDGIEAVRDLLPYCHFDKEKCKTGLMMLREYRKKRNEALSSEDRPVYQDSPIKNDTCHAADALRYAATGFRYLDLRNLSMALPSYTGQTDKRFEMTNARINDINGIDNFSDMFSEESEACYTN